MKRPGNLFFIFTILLLMSCGHGFAQETLTSSGEGITQTVSTETTGVKLKDETPVFETNTDGTLTAAHTFPKAGKNPITSAEAVTVPYDPNGIVIPPDEMFTIEGDGNKTYEVVKSTGEGTYPDKNERLTVTKTGTFKVTVSVKADGEYAAANASAVLTVTKAGPNFGITMEGWKFGETAKDPKVDWGITGDGTVSYTYYTDRACTVKTSAANSGAPADGGKPSWAGTWYVTASVPETDLYNAFTTKAPVSFTIAKDEIFYTNIEISDIYTITSRAEALPEPYDPGPLRYEPGGVKVEGQVKSVSASVENGNLIITLSDGADGDKITVPVTIISRNYEDITLNVILTLGTKADAKVSFAEGTSRTITFGESLTLHAKAEKEGTNGKWT